VLPVLAVDTTRPSSCMCVCVCVCVCVDRQDAQKSKRLCSGGVCSSYSSPVTKASCLTQLKWQFTVTTVVADKTPRLTETRPLHSIQECRETYMICSWFTNLAVFLLLDSRLLYPLLEIRVRRRSVCTLFSSPHVSWGTSVPNMDRLQRRKMGNS